MATWVGQGTNMNNTMKLADIENPQFGTRIWEVSSVQAEL